MNSENQFSSFDANVENSQSLNIKSKTSKKSQVYSKKWTVPENILYARYLKTHIGQMNNKKKKKSGKFVKMANFIGSKTQNQCRSHHQKMLLTFKSIQNIIKYAAEIKKTGELIPLDAFQQVFRKGQKSQDDFSIQSKIEEQVSTQKQSQQQQIKPQSMSSKLKNDLFLNDFPIVEEESKQLEEIEFKNDIFDVLNIDPSNSYSGFFIL